MTSRNTEGRVTAATRSRNAAATRSAILQAAVGAFTRSGYDGVGLRDIAKEAGIDPRLVGRYFGSKEELFAEVLALITQAPVMVPPVHENAAAELLTRPRPAEYLHGYLMTIRSTSSPQAVALLRDVIRVHGEEPLAERLDVPEADGRAALLIAVFLGILLMRDVLGNARLNGEEGQRVVPHLDAALQSIARHGNGGDREDAGPRGRDATPDGAPGGTTGTPPPSHSASPDASAPGPMVERMVPDRLWDLFQRVVPSAPTRPQGGGRRRYGDREVLAAIVFVATADCTWREVPAVFGPSGPTAHRRFSEWSTAGVWTRLNRLVSNEPDPDGSLAWSRFAADAVAARALKGGTT